MVSPLPPEVAPGRVRGFDLAGRRAIVYGVESPLGQAVLAGLREAGATVAVTSATTGGDALFKLKRAAAGSPAEAVDLRNAASVQVATKKLRKRLGGLDIAVAAPDAYFAAPIAKTPDADVAQVLSGNLTATYNVFRSASREIAGKSEGGRLLALISAIGLRGLPQLSAYAAAHAGIVGLVRSLAQELGPAGITTNAIAAGWLTSTPGRGAADPADNLLLRFIPMKRFGSPDEIAPLAVYLCSTAAGYYNGQIVAVDGGALTHG